MENLIRAYLYPKLAEFERQMRELTAQVEQNSTARANRRSDDILEIVAQAFSEASGIPREAFTMLNAPPELLVDNRLRGKLAETLGSEELAERYFPTGKFADENDLRGGPLYPQPSDAAKDLRSVLERTETSIDHNWRDGIGANPLAPFLWINHKGEAQYPRDMATPHLYYSLRMLWNNTVPPAFRVGKFKRYNDIAGWSRDYVKRAIDELSRELSNRDLDLELSDTPGTTIEEQLGDMVANLDVIFAFQI